MQRDGKIYGFSIEKDGTHVILVPDNADTTIFETLNVKIRLIRMNRRPTIL
jgi:hypothetical protein